MPDRVPGLGHDPDFLKLWAGGFVSTLGFHITILAMQLTAAVVLGASPFEMGLLGAAQFLPRFMFGLVAGGWVDRVRRRPLMIATDLGRAALLGSVPIGYLLGFLSIRAPESSSRSTIVAIPWPTPMHIVARP
jgi:MFS family permease